MREEDGTHNCHFCGTFVNEGYETVHEKVEVRDVSGDRGIPSARDPKEFGTQWITTKKRHWLSDCRPDLVEHEPGELCTWHRCEDKDGTAYSPSCYAYQDRDTREWGSEHKHFYSDGPM
jgi:hypothetical protein